MIETTRQTRNLDSIQPLTGHTKHVLRKQIFGNDQIAGGCLAYQSLAERIVCLKNLQNEYENKNIDLGIKDRAWAIAKCIGTALLVVAAAAFTFFVISHVAPFGSAPADAIGIIWSLPTVFLAGSCGLFFIACACHNANLIFKRPTPEQLTEQLAQIANEEISDEHATQMENIEQRLTFKIEVLEANITGAAQVGNIRKQKDLETQKAAIQSALMDVHRLRISL